jgi:hypothetical protein
MKQETALTKGRRLMKQKRAQLREETDPIKQAVLKNDIAWIKLALNSAY